MNYFTCFGQQVKIEVEAETGALSNHPAVAHMSNSRLAKVAPRIPVTKPWEHLTPENKPHRAQTTL